MEKSCHLAGAFRPQEAAFTLIEILVALTIFTLLLLSFAVLLTSISQTYNRSGGYMNVLSEARFALDRIGSDLDRRLNRDDVPVSIQALAGNDTMSFYAAVSSATPVAPNARGMAIVAYRINQSATGTDYQLQRAANGVSWDTSSPLATVNPLAASVPASPVDSDYDTASEAVFRMECSTTDENGNIVAQAPSDPFDFAQKVDAIVVTVAALDPKMRGMLSNPNSQLALLVSQFPDAVDGSLPGSLWAQKVNNIKALAASTGIPIQVLSSIQISTRTYHVN